MTATPRPRQPAESRRRQIAEAALAIVAEQGLGRFTTAAVAERVGIAEGTIFRHFDAKEDIVLAAMARLEERVFAGFPPEDADPLDRIGRFVRARSTLLATEPALARVVFSDQLVHAAGERGAAMVRAWRARTVGFLRACFAEAKDAGLLAEGVDVDDLALLVQGAIVASALHGAAAADRAPRAWATLLSHIRRFP